MPNLATTIFDKKFPIDNNGAIDSLSDRDCHLFRSIMERRSLGSGRYRFGFNGYENDNEIKGIGNSIDFGARVYDSRLGRFLSLDPLMKDYPMMTPYCFAANNPIRLIDINGEAPGDPFESADEAAIDKTKTYNDNKVLSKLNKGNKTIPPILELTAEPVYESNKD